MYCIEFNRQLISEFQENHKANLKDRGEAILKEITMKILILLFLKMD